LLDEIQEKLKVATKEDEDELLEIFNYLIDMRKEVVNKLGIVVEK
jgi:hypothetical protein